MKLELFTEIMSALQQNQKVVGQGVSDQNLPSSTETLSTLDLPFIAPPLHITMLAHQNNWLQAIPPSITPLHSMPSFVIPRIDTIVANLVDTHVLTIPRPLMLPIHSAAPDLNRTPLGASVLEESLDMQYAQILSEESVS